ncbi:MAG TPA: ABC transporter substrate-binding protein [Terriglobales bacterium]|nr:ABC transporter substrate-binding protein [Terriglobales bacterium]
MIVALLVATAWAQRQILPVHGVRGGELVAAAASDPQTLNPVFATDNASQLISSLTQADLMHINPRTLKVEPALATKVVQVSDRVWKVELRRDVKFSDGVPFTSADVAFSFAVYTDPKLDAPERELLTVKGAPIRCRVTGPLEVELDLPAPVAVGDRLFDSVWMLPQHLLDPIYRRGQLQQAWGPSTPPAQMAGLGAFRLDQFAPGQSVHLARNPYYWQADATGAALPYVNGVRLRVVADANLRFTLFARGQLDGMDPVSSADFVRLQGNPCCHMMDAGPGLNSEVLVLNFAARPYFARPEFRRALSQAIDRANLVANVYDGKAVALASLTSPSSGMWADPTPPTAVNPAAARAALAAIGFHVGQGEQGVLRDPQGQPVSFSLLVPATNQARMKMAVFLQEDLRRIGIAMAVVPVDFATYVDRLLHRRDFEAALLGVQIPDADPNTESNEWTLAGSLHLWNHTPSAAPGWELDLDRWFQQQLATTDPAERLRIYRRIQATERQQLPLIPLLAPDILSGTRTGLQAAAPALLPPHWLWNAAELYWSPERR